MSQLTFGIGLPLIFAVSTTGLPSWVSMGCSGVKTVGACTCSSSSLGCLLGFDGISKRRIFSMLTSGVSSTPPKSLRGLWFGWIWSKTAKRSGWETNELWSTPAWTGCFACWFCGRSNCRKTSIGINDDWSIEGAPRTCSVADECCSFREKETFTLGISGSWTKSVPVDRSRPAGYKCPYRSHGHLWWSGWRVCWADRNSWWSGYFRSEEIDLSAIGR